MAKQTSGGYKPFSEFQIRLLLGILVFDGFAILTISHNTPTESQDRLPLIIAFIMIAIAVAVYELGEFLGNRYGWHYKWTEEYEKSKG